MTTGNALLPSLAACGGFSGVVLYTATTTEEQWGWPGMALAAVAGYLCLPAVIWGLLWLVHRWWTEPTRPDGGDDPG